MLILSIVIIASIVFTVYFESFFMNFIIEELTTKQGYSIERIHNSMYELRNITAQISSNYDVASLIYHKDKADIVNQTNAMKFIKSIKAMSFFNSFYIISSDRTTYWQDTSMTPMGFESILDKVPEIKSILTAYENDKILLYPDNIKNCIYYVCEDKYNNIIIYKTTGKVFEDRFSIKDAYQIRTWIYYDDVLVYDTGGFEDVYKQIGNKLEDDSYFTQNNYLYKYTKNTDITYISKYDYNKVKYNAIRNSAFLWILLLMISVVVCFVYFKFNMKYERMKKNYDHKIQNISRENEKNNIKRIITNIVSDIEVTAEEYELLKSYFEEKGSKSFYGIMFRFNTNKVKNEDGNSFKFYIYKVVEIMEQNFKNVGLYLYSLIDAEKLVFVISVDEECDFKDIIGKVHNSINNSCKIDIAVAVSEKYHSLSTLIDKYGNLNSIIEYTFLKGNDALIFEDEIGGRRTSEASEFAFEKFLTYLKNGDNEQLERLLDEYIETLSSEKPQIASELFLKFVLNIFSNNNKSITYHDVTMILNADTLKVGKEYLKGALLKNNTEIANESIDADAVFMNYVKSIVEKKYTEVNFDMSVVADELHLNKAYFGRKFRVLFEQSFSNYLSEYRVEAACRLLVETEMKVVDISEQCGFGSHIYFGSVFKKSKNMSPNDYRIKHKKDGQEL